MLAAALLPAPGLAQALSPEEQAALEHGLGAAFRGCALWVLDPASWASGPQPFIDALALGPSLMLVREADEVMLPPEDLRVSNHYWRINATLTGGFMLVVSDRLPMCHITGGAAGDLQPVVEAVLASPGFAGQWEWLGEEQNDGMLSSLLRHRAEPALEMVVSRASRPGGRLNRVQVIATALLAPRDEAAP